MKVFVSASWKDRWIAKDIMDYLEKNGHVVTDRWYEHEDGQSFRDYAREDYDGIRECDVYVMYNGDKYTGGKYVELGMAIAWGKRIIICGIKLRTVFRAFVDWYIKTTRNDEIDYMLKRVLEKIET